ncbi:MAG: DNA-processing protein DprA [Erysipelotrichales bacterium]|nr:DNA-processing protein DprA [Erysipelotrichales bacterium]
MNTLEKLTQHYPEVPHAIQRVALMYTHILQKYHHEHTFQYYLQHDPRVIYTSIPTHIHQQNPSYLTCLDPHYPDKLLHLYNYPCTLFYQGNIDLLKLPSIGIIGSRENDAYGERVIFELIKRLPEDIVVISGLAKGCDGLAHKYALEENKPTIAIIGSGMAYTYPLCNKDLYQKIQERGLLLSEYEYHEPIRKHQFIQRNRLIAALSDHLVVIESTLHSGTLITVNEMLGLGKEVYVVPHPLFSRLGEGNLRLLNEGANILFSIEEFVNSIKRV